MVYNEDDWLQLSGLQHFAFCRRQWALIHIENQWMENYRTVDGHLMHERVHDQEFRESRCDLLIVRGLSIHQGLQCLFAKRPVPAEADAKPERLRLFGQCDGGYGMKHLLNTLYILSTDIFLSLDGENIVANRDKQVVARYPLHTLQNIVTFSYSGASPALMGACAERQIGLAFCTPRGKFLARSCGESTGNVLLRRTQYRAADDPVQCCQISRTMIFGKLFNARWSIERTHRDHGLRVDSEKLTSASQQIYGLLSQIRTAASLEELRGLEGVGASAYFGVFNEMILGSKEVFTFHGRSRRPPLDAVNALLSFTYSLLAHDCASALESVGLDSYVGFLHRDRPGRTSLALDLMEELRPCMADRFVLTLINNRQLKASDFLHMESGAVLLTDDGRKTFLKSWQEKKKETLTHPYLKEKLPWGMIPHIQALLLVRHLRGDLDTYPPFLWK